MLVNTSTTPAIMTFIALPLLSRPPHRLRSSTHQLGALRGCGTGVRVVISTREATGIKKGTRALPFHILIPPPQQHKTSGRFLLPMQRDVYAALVKRRHKHRIPIRIFQVNGKTTQEPIYDDVFIGYKLRRLVLMTNMAAQTLNPDMIIPDFQTLKRYHQPHMMYKLLPLQCSTIEAFAALQGICASAGSVFQIEDRVGPQHFTHRFPLGCANRQAICDFFAATMPAEDLREPAQTRRLPVMGVEYQGALLREGRRRVPLLESATGCAETTEPKETLSSRQYVSAAALLTMHDTLSEKMILNRGLMRDFMESDVYCKMLSNTSILNRYKRCQCRMHMMGVTNPIGKDIGNGSRQRMLELARERRIYIYEKVMEGVYRYAV